MKRWAMKLKAQEKMQKKFPQSKSKKFQSRREKESESREQDQVRYVRHQPRRAKNADQNFKHFYELHEDDYEDYVK